MSNEKIADIIAELRNASNGACSGMVMVDAKKYADRIEAALVREQSKRSQREIGNAAKMRDALEECVELLRTLHTDDCGCEDCCEIRAVIEDAQAALSAPARNCDRFKTKEEAALAYAIECNAFIPQSILWQIGEWLEWLFAEAEGEAK